MAIVLALKDGGRFDFTEDCYFRALDDGRVVFLPRRSESGCGRIFLHKGAWVIDARKCAQTVTALGRPLKDKPRQLPARVVVTCGRARFLFAVSQLELERAYVELRERSQRMKTVDTAPPSRGTELHLSSEETRMLTESIDEAGTAAIALDGSTPAERGGAPDPTDFGLTGIAEAVVSDEVESLHARHGKQPSGGDETPRKGMGDSTGIDEVDGIASSKASNFITSAFPAVGSKKPPPKRSTPPPLLVDDEPGEETIPLELVDDVEDDDDTHSGRMPPVR